MPGEDRGADGGAGIKELAPGVSRRRTPDISRGRSYLRRGRNGHQPSSELATAQPQSVHPVRDRHRDSEFVAGARASSYEAEGRRAEPEEQVTRPDSRVPVARERPLRPGYAAGLAPLLPTRRRGRPRWQCFSARPPPGRGSLAGGGVALVGLRLGWARAALGVTAPGNPLQFYVLVRIPGTLQISNTFQPHTPRSAAVAQHLGAECRARIRMLGVDSLADTPSQRQISAAARSR
jgi:hypothetical protein